MAHAMSGGLDGIEPAPMYTTDSGSRSDAVAPSSKDIHNPNVPFEEYLYWAKLSRAEEQHFTSETGTPLGKVFLKKKKKVESSPTREEKEKEKEAFPVENHENVATGASPSLVSDDEWAVAGRAGRTATWGAVFYLITTDILGPFSVPWALSQMGYGAGVTLYTVFGILAGYAGWQLYYMFLGLDSTRYPLRTYSDLGFRIFGTWARHALNVLQTLQLLLNVGVIVIANGQGLSQVTKGKVCFSVLCIIWTIAGAILGQIRTIRSYGWIANMAVWLNLLVIFITMGVVANSAPNFTAAMAQNGVAMGPVRTTGGAMPGVAFQGQVVGLMQGVYSYGGSILFVELMAEMRRPMDFWKGLICAQLLIYVAYIFFGLFVYSFQGQFTINPAFQGISPFSWQTTTNVISLVTALLAAGLYSNIGMKVMYQNIISDLLGAPDLNTKKGKILWACIVPIYWSIAFVVASAIPQINNVSALVAALAILQFTYTFPPMMMLGFDIKKDAMLSGDGFDPATGRVTRNDGGWKRWIRGFRVKWHVNSFNVIFAAGAAVTAVLGIYSSVLGIKAGFERVSATTSFGCQSPLG